VTGLKNATRPDELIDYTAGKQKLLNIAPDTLNDHLKVKRMVA
jgi:hypothetical protein